MATTEGNCGEDPEFDSTGERSQEASGNIPVFLLVDLTDGISRV